MVISLGNGYPAAPVKFLPIQKLSMFIRLMVALFEKGGELPEPLEVRVPSG